MVRCISFINIQTIKKSTVVLKRVTVNQKLKPSRNELSLIEMTATVKGNWQYILMARALKMEGAGGGVDNEIALLLNVFLPH